VGSATDFSRACRGAKDFSAACCSQTAPGLSAKSLVECPNNLANFGSRQRIENVLTVPPRLHQTIGAKARKLLRYSRLTQTERFLNRRNRFFFLNQQAKNQKPRFMRQSFQKSAGVPSAGNQRVNVEKLLLWFYSVLRLHGFTLEVGIVGCINHPASENATGRHCLFGRRRSLCPNDASSTRHASL